MATSKASNFSDPVGGGAKPVPCASDRDLWFPDLDGASKSQWRSFKRHTLPVIGRTCGRCHFRIMCAVMALETQATNGIWAGVLVRDYSNPGTWHRKQLLALLAEFVAEALDKDPAEIDPQYDTLCERIAVMLQRRPQLQSVFDAALTDALACTDTGADELRPADGPERNASTSEGGDSDLINLYDQLRLLEPVGIPA